MGVVHGKDGRFLKGLHYSAETEFKMGEHWRNPKPYWDKEWLLNEYIKKKKPAKQIAKEQGCKENNILYFLDKFKTPRRDMKVIRAEKYWGLKGETNGMFGRKGEENPHWKGGITPKRQAFYSSLEWNMVCQKVWRRDKATCQRCEKKKTNTDEFHIHHIISFSVEKLRLDLDNLILLCKDCHHFVHSTENKNKEFLGGDNYPKT